MNHTDVLIVGAGPTGLTAATILARYGVDVRIIDTKAGPVKESRALGVQARTLELWDKLGLAAQAVRDGQQVNAVNLLTKRTLKHTNAQPFLMLDRGGSNVTPYPFMLVYEQNKTERMLLNDLHAHGTTVMWNTELVSLVQRTDSVDVTLRTADGQEETVRACYVIGADGVHSFVRRTLDVGFDGATYAESLFIADVDMHWSLPRDTFYLQMPRHGLLAFFPMRGDGYTHDQYRIIGRLPREWAHKEHITHTDLQQLLNRYSVVHASVTNVRWTSTYRIHKRMAAQFRIHRVFLVGDAAHIHSPAGGQGMNTGIQDAWNLAWKVALVVRGEAQAILLNSYEPERMPIARTLLNGTDQTSPYYT